MPSESYLNINESVTSFSDVGMTNNPLMRHFDWSRNLNGLTVYNPKAEQHLVPPRSMLSIFDTLRNTLFDGTTQIQLSYLKDSTYRFKFTGTGTDPRFAVNNYLAFVATQLTVSVSPNQTVTITSGSGTPFSTVQVGSYIYIYNTTDHVGAAFSILNTGLWEVLGSSDTVLTLARPAGTAFEAVEEVVTCGAANNMINYVLAEVQVGDKLRVGPPFAIGSQQTFVVSAVTSKWVDVVSTVPLVDETLLPGVTGMVFYGASKRFTRIESDQRAKVYFNGSVGESDEIEPWAPGDRKLMGWQEKVGPVWSLDIYNLSNTPMVVNVFTCE